MKHGVGFLPIIAMTSLFLAGCSGKTEEEVVNLPETTSAPASATLASLAKDGPVALYFAKKSCGSNGQAIPLVESVYKAYGDKVRMFAVVNATDEEYPGWSKGFGMTMPNVADMDMSLVNTMGFKDSQHLVLLDKDGNPEVIEGGFGREALMALNAALAKQAGVEPAEIDLSAAPSGAAYG